MNTNNYVIVSNDKITIDTRVKKIIEDKKIKDYELIRFDYPDETIDSVIESLNTYNFLSSTKVIVFNNCTFLSKEQDKSIKALKEYLEHPSDNYLIMATESISESKEIKELLSKNVDVEDNKISSEVLIKNNLEDYLMDNKVVKYFAEYCLYNNEKILNELDKIKNYKYSEKDKNITVDDINRIAIRDYEEDIFDLVNAIATRNKDKAFELYNRISKKEKDSVNIIASISSNIRNLYSVKVLQDQGYKQQEISTILGVKPYAVQVSSQTCNNYSEKKLLSLLNTLADIDYKTKSGNGRVNALFEMFLLNL